MKRLTSFIFVRRLHCPTPFSGLLCSVALALAFSISDAQAAGTWMSTGSMSIEREAFSAVQLKDGRVLVSGGINNGGVLATAEVYDPVSGTWSPTGNMNLARAYNTATLLKNGKVLVAGGCTNSNCSAATNTAEVYDPATGAWQKAGRMSTLRYFFNATSLPNGNILVEGGCNQGNCGTVTSSADLFNPRTGKWTPTGSMNTARDYHTATMLGSGKVLVTGGYTVQGASNSVEIYDPASGTWSTGAGMLASRALHSATALPDGRAVIAGGLVAFLPSDLSEVYDPVTNSWSSAGNLITKRAGQEAVLLKSGIPMITGGYTYVRPDYFEIASCELFDPATNTWSVTGEMTSPRYLHALQVLKNGQVLAAGGLNNSVTLSSADIYTP